MGIGMIKAGRDGRRRMPVLTRHELGGYEIARLLCQRAHEWQPELWDRAAANDQGRNMTRTEVRTLIIDSLHTGGRSTYLSEDLLPDLDEWQTERVVCWAVRQVERLYPRLVDKALTLFVAEATEARQGREEWQRRYDEGDA